jgi:hypothetical protein
MTILVAGNFATGDPSTLGIWVAVLSVMFFYFMSRMRRVEQRVGIQFGRRSASGRVGPRSGLSISTRVLLLDALSRCIWALWFLFALICLGATKELHRPDVGQEAFTALACLSLLIIPIRLGAALLLLR